MRRAAYLRLPLRFEAIPRDRAGEPAFVARGLGYSLHLSPAGAALALQTHSGAPAFVTMRLPGGVLSKPIPRRPLPGVSNHIEGRDRRAWRLGVPGYAEVAYPGVYPGIDVVFYGSQQKLEYDFRVAPGAAPSTIALDFGAAGKRIDASGNLVIASVAGDVVQHAPIVYQDVAGIRRTVDAGYVIRSNGLVGFHVGSYDRRLPLVIDPILTYSTYLGGSGFDRTDDVAVDPAGEIIVAGVTGSDDFPLVNPSQAARRGFGDVFVAKLTPAGDALVFATYLGGGSFDETHGLATDAEGNTYVVGETFSPDFPVTADLHAGPRDYDDAFVAKLDASGALVYSTLVGGAEEDNGTAVAVDALGRAHITGATVSADFPTLSALQPSIAGYPAFRSTDGTATWSGIAAGLKTSAARAFAFDSSTQPETIYAGTQIEGVFASVDGGQTWTRPLNENLPTDTVAAMAIGSGSPAKLYAAMSSGVFRSDDRGDSWADLHLNLPVSSLVVVPDSPSTVYAGVLYGSDEGVFRSTDDGATWTPAGLPSPVTLLAASGSTVYAATALHGLYRSADGGPWTEVDEGLSDEVIAFAVTPGQPDLAYAATFDGLSVTSDGGITWSPIQIFTGIPIASIAVPASDPDTLYVSSFWGFIAISHDGGLTWEAGTMPAATTVSPLAVDPSSPTTLFAGNFVPFDAFVATLSADGTSLEQSTYVGGSNHDVATGIALDASGAAYIVGDTHSADLPVLHAVQPLPGDQGDIFVAKLSAAGALEYSTYLGGRGSEYAGRIAVDAGGRAYVTGLTWSNNFPVFNAVQPATGGGFSDIFVSALDASGQSFVYSTYFGGSGMENDPSQSMGPDIAVTGSGDAYVAGTTMSANFPVTADALQKARAGGSTDGFIAAFDPVGRVKYSTYIGGSGADFPRAIAVAGIDAAVVAGSTNSADLPIVGGVQPSYGGTQDAFVLEVVPGTPPPDTTPPHSEVSVSGTTGLAGWYRSAVQVTVSAQDDPLGSGVASVQYSVNSGPFQPYAGPFTIDAQGATSMASRAIDRAGNQETPRPATDIRIDSVVPAISIASPEARDYLHTDVLALTFDAADETSGMAGSPTAALDGAPVTGSTIALLSQPLGDHAFTVSGADVAGNASQRTVTFRVVATLDSLIKAVQIYTANGSIDDGTSRGLLAKLNDAAAASSRGNVQVVKGKLQDFIDQCTASAGNGVAADAAAVLIADARWVLGTL